MSLQIVASNGFSSLTFHRIIYKGAHAKNPLSIMFILFIQMKKRILVVVILHLAIRFPFLTLHFLHPPVLLSHLGVQFLLFFQTPFLIVWISFLTVWFIFSNRKLHLVRWGIFFFFPLSTSLCKVTTCYCTKNKACGVILTLNQFVIEILLEFKLNPTLRGKDPIWKLVMIIK